MPNLLDKALAELACDLRSGAVSSAALAEAAIDNYERTKAALGAYKAWEPALLRRQAAAADAVFASGGDLGPLHGLPVSLKDLYGVRGYPTFAGTPRRLPDMWEREGPVVAALRRQQAVVAGKTHTVEFAFGGIGVNPHWETPINPWDKDTPRAPGGSSSGAGVSLATGTAVLALGTDTAGSVRIPASVTGNVGLKTSIGRWSVDGIVPLSPSLDTAGPLARTVADVAYGFFALDPAYGPAGAFAAALNRLESLEVAGLRLGRCHDLLWQDCAPGVVEGVETALDALVAKGARVVPLSLPEFDAVDPLFRKGGLAAAELYVFIKAELPEWLDIIDEKIAQRMSEARTLPAYEYLERARLFRQLSSSVDSRLDAVDAVVTPTVAITPPPISDMSKLDRYKGLNLLSLRNTGVANYLGLCALTIPVARDAAGMPVGMQLIARHGHEERLLAVGRACERLLGTAREQFGAPPLVPF